MANRRTSRGSKNRTNTKQKRANLYAWAWKTRGKGQLSKIGKKMKSLKRSGGVGSKKAIIQLGRISSEKQAFIKGYKACKKGR
ncbi:hypothetical protein [Flavivirga sp. 57AJ16]|uniref:hypothetical protein n=1 Tax=Flavivirga sp. 57AJ16 TaxID=3025307 RepID=UPI0023655315|nr:hypothetical protein [Flavivirga sp. 57AJ16]MDD7885749.1 hypothetical protein [Flavivirga sp. 57AJ16]